MRQSIANTRLLPRIDAAAYIGLSVVRFDDLVKAGKIPSPVKWAGIDKKLWDVRRVDEAIDALSEPVAADDWGVA